MRPSLYCHINLNLSEKWQREIIHLKLFDKDGSERTQFHVGDPITLQIVTNVPEPLTTFIKKIQLSNDQNQKVVLIENFCRTEQTKNLVFDFNEVQRRFNTDGQGRVQILVHGPNFVDPEFRTPLRKIS